ncbi:MAG: ABC transporter permease [Acidimicrobiales bacterium]
MTTIETTVPVAAPPVSRSEIRPRHAGFVNDVISVASRAIRSIGREPEFVAPAIIIPVFFFFVNTGAMQDITQAQAPGFDYKAFALPACIIFGVTGISRAGVVVTDVQDGYFDRLLLTPVRRLALLLGMMVADVVLVAALCVPIVLLGLLAGVDFETGVLGMLGFVVLGSLWGLVFTGFPYAIALKTGNPAAVNSSFLLFFPFAFLTTSFMPRQALTGWMDTVSTYNPVTYLLDGMRVLVTDGWEWDVIGKAVLAVAGVGVVSMWLCFAALRGRLKSG